MVFKRKIYDELIDWKNSLSIKRKALIIKGLRQVGKTFIALEFAKSNYENVIYLNFKDNRNLRSIFQGNFDVDEMILNISANVKGTKLVPNKTVLIFDEIQECQDARSSIKSFVLDGRFDIIATGSMLGLSGYNKKPSKGVPVGYEHIVYMKPMDFLEFLWASSTQDEVIKEIEKDFKERKKIPDAIHERMLRLFKEYICIGGMPSVVNIFINTHDMNQVVEAQKDLLEEYKDDFGKHLDENENEIVDKKMLLNIDTVFKSIPSQLAKENKKFSYSLLEKKGRSNKYFPAIEWLKEYGLIELCNNLKMLELPLKGNIDESAFKVYMTDTGLFTTMLDDESKANILSGNLGMHSGAIYENIVADAFIKKGKNLYYYKKDSGLEIDFITKENESIILIEVKATSGRTKSASSILKNKNYKQVKKCIKLGEYNIGENENILTIPYYLAYLI